MTTSSNQQDEAAIRAHIEALFQAFIDRDRETIRRGHTNDWHGFQVFSRHVIQGIDDYMEAADRSLEVIRDTRYQILEFVPQLFGDLAVIYLVATVWGLDDDGIERPNTIRAVDIYRREATGWNQCGSNICLVPDDGGPGPGDRVES